MQQGSDPRLEGIKDLREWLNENGALYKEMKQRLQDPKAMRRILLNLKAASEPVLSYNPMNEPQVAVFIVAELKTNLEGFFQDFDFVELYEEKKDQLRELSQFSADPESDEEPSADLAASG